MLLLCFTFCTPRSEVGGGGGGGVWESPFLSVNVSVCPPVLILSGWYLLNHWSFCNHLQVDIDKECFCISIRSSEPLNLLCPNLVCWCIMSRCNAMWNVRLSFVLSAIVLSSRLSGVFEVLYPYIIFMGLECCDLNSETSCTCSHILYPGALLPDRG